MPLLVITGVILVLAVLLWIYVSRPEKVTPALDLEADTTKVVMLWDPKLEQWVFFDPTSTEGWQRHRRAMRMHEVCTDCGRDFSKGMK